MYFGTRWSFPVRPLSSSRSIVQINVSLSFQPHSINVIQKTCQRGGRDSACLMATACFTTVSRSPGPHSNSFGTTLHITSSLIAFDEGRTHVLILIRTGLFQLSLFVLRHRRVVINRSVLRPVGVGHVG